ncbi:GMC oxidoreductase [Hysterangium stoloniferum]|nr:GMC oxidoreductase [Hysterangium stoloniferum]
MGITLSKNAIGSDPSLVGTRSDPKDSYRAPSQWKTYDYVIVGGGTAGCVLASRLSENPNATVLLVEAGQSHKRTFFTKFPMGFAKLLKTKADWEYYSAPQENLNNRQVYMPRGKILGGTSSLNACIYHRCSPQDFNSWAANGAEGWSYDELHPYFMKSEGYAASASKPDVKLKDHGFNGPWKTSEPDVAPLHHVIMEACAVLGIPWSPDLNTPNGTLGASSFTAFIDTKGRRTSSATAYLTPDVLSRRNLTIIVKSRVDKILFDTNTSISRPRAIGVEFSQARNSPRYRVHARKEIIICAGAFNTPQVLLLSGIGPAADLEEKGIEVIKDLPAVGQNLFDHQSCGALCVRTKAAFSWDYLAKPLPGVFALVQWLLKHKGPLTSLPCQGGAFLRSDNPSISFESNKNEGDQDIQIADLTSGLKSPDIEFMWFPVLVVNNGFSAAPANMQGMTISALALKPESVGRVFLKTTSVWDKPIIHSNFFSSENDMKLIICATRLLLKLIKTEPLASIVESTPLPGKSYNFLWPGNVSDPDEITDEQLREWICKNTSPAYHPTSSARMGISEKSSVIDSKLCVHGVDGLRVVDASAFPTQVSGHPCAVVIAMAEKAADLIKAAAEA